MNTIKFSVTGMTCGGCVNSVKKVLGALPGVHTVDVTLDPGQVNVSYDPAQIAPAAMVQTIIDAGYGVTS